MAAKLSVADSIVFFWNRNLWNNTIAVGQPQLCKRGLSIKRVYCDKTNESSADTYLVFRPFFPYCMATASNRDSSYTSDMKEILRDRKGKILTR